MLRRTEGSKSLKILKGSIFVTGEPIGRAIKIIPWLPKILPYPVHDVTAAPLPIGPAPDSDLAYG